MRPARNVVFRAPDAYRPRAGPAAVLHAVVRDHLEELLRAARAHGDGTGVPAFVETSPSSRTIQ